MLQSVRFAHLRVVRKDLLRGYKAVHDWHTDIHQNEVVNHFATTLSQIEFDLVISFETI